MQRPRQPLLSRFEDQTFLRIKNAVSTKTDRVSTYCLQMHTHTHTHRHHTSVCVRVVAGRNGLDSFADIDYDTQQLLRCAAPPVPTPAGEESVRTPAPRPREDRDLLGFLAAADASTELDLAVGGGAAAVAVLSLSVRSSCAAAATLPGSVFCRCCINRTRFCCAVAESDDEKPPASVSETERKRSALTPSRSVRREQSQRR